MTPVAQARGSGTTHVLRVKRLERSWAQRLFGMLRWQIFSCMPRGANAPSDAVLGPRAPLPVAFPEVSVLQRHGAVCEPETVPAVSRELWLDHAYEVAHTCATIIRR